MDRISNALCEIKNGYQARHQLVILPASLLVFRMCQIMKSRGFLESVEWISFTEISPGYPDKIVVFLRYLGPNRLPSVNGIKRVSKPGSKIYLPSKSLPRILGGLGLVIVSTSLGLMSASRARSLGLGGEVICFVW